MQPLRAQYRSIKRMLKRALRPDSTLDFGLFKMTVDSTDYGGAMYASPEYWGELICPLDKEIVRRFKPGLFLDIGANYGFTSLVHWTMNDGCRIVAVEPSPRLLPYLERNLVAGGVRDFKIVEAICSDELGTAKFQLNPSSSQDNRVRGEKHWASVNVDAVTIDYLLLGVEAFVYIKTDTQGFEEKVLSGGAEFLSVSRQWLLKMEFAPRWLEHQGTDPVAFLTRLATEYRVIELPKRTRYKGDNLRVLYSTPILASDADSFVSYIRALNNGAGWCDLLVAPKTLKI